MLTTGFKTTTLDNMSSIVSYSEPIPSAFELGKLTQPNDEQINENYVIIVYAQSATIKMKNNIDKIISNIQRVSKSIVGITFFIVMTAILIILFSILKDIAKNIKIYKLVIQSYCLGFDKYHEFVNRKN